MKPWQSCEVAAVIDRKTILKLSAKILMAIAFSVERKGSQK